MNRWICYTSSVCVLFLAQLALVVEASQKGKPTPKPTPNPKPNPNLKPGPGQGKNLAAPLTRRIVGNTESAFITRKSHKIPPKLTKKDRKSMQGIVKNPAVTKAEANALDKVLAGEALSPQERSTLSSLALDERPGVTPMPRS